EEQLRAVHVVVERLLRARGWHLFEGIVEPEPQCLLLERPGRPPHRLRHESRRSSRQDEHYRLATSQSWMARWVSPDRWNTSRASSGPLTMGYPWRLNQVLAMPPMPVNGWNPLRH